MYYKILGENRLPIHGGDGRWPEPGEWRDVSGKLVSCKNGLHLCRRDQLIAWLGPCIWEAEADPAEIIVDTDKVIARRARLIRQLDAWNTRSQRLFAADCAERVLHLYEREHPGDTRPRDAIAAARAYAIGAIDDDERAATQAAAWAAAEAAAWAATQAAAWAAAWAAARAAAQAAAETAAWDAAEAAERAWQTERLFDYLEGRI